MKEDAGVRYTTASELKSSNTLSLTSGLCSSLNAVMAGRSWPAILLAASAPCLNSLRPAHYAAKNMR